MKSGQYLRGHSHLRGLRDRLSDTSQHLQGLAAVVDRVSPGATEGVWVAIHAIQGVVQDLDEMHIPDSDTLW